MIHSIVPLVSAIVLIFLLAVIFLNRQWQKQHKLLAIYIIAAIFWAIGDSILRSDFLLEYKLLLFIIVILGSVWWSVQFYYFLRAFVGLPGGYVVWFGYASLFTLGITAALNYWPESLTFNAGVTAPDRGWWFFLYAATMLAIAFSGLYVTIRRFKNLSKPKERNKVAYLIMAIGMLAVFGFPGMTPLAHGFPLSTIGVLFAACILTYAVAKHELISVNYILRRGIAWAGVITVGIAACISLFLLVNSVISIDIESSHLALAVLAGIAIAISIFLLRNLFVTRVD